jgi:carbonic anhydrase/acetyltransferase-like protein (isoleucine patch superfamily)
MPLWHSYPAIYDSAAIADNASLAGEVVVGDHAQIGYGVTMRGDHHAIRIGNNTSIGDNSVIVCALHRLPTNVPHSVNIGRLLITRRP